MTKPYKVDRELVVQMVERSLSMREIPGSMPGFSTSTYVAIHPREPGACMTCNMMILASFDAFYRLYHTYIGIALYSIYSLI